MNKSGDSNRSVRNTKKRLREELLRLMKQKPINQISVREISENADVNRGTFYFHYSDVYDMLHKIEDDFFTQFNEVLNLTAEDASDPTSYLSGIFSFLGENQDMCRVLMSRNSDMVFLERLKQLVAQRCTVQWEKYIPDISEKQIKFYNSFVIQGCAGFIQQWLADDFAESPEEISVFLARFLLGIIKSAGSAQNGPQSGLPEE